MAVALCSAWSGVSLTAAQPAASAPAPQSAAAATAAPPLLSVNKAGLWELGPDYKPVRRLSKSPARFGRYLPGRQQVLLYFSSGLVDEQPVLRLFDLATQKERVVAKLPTGAPGTVFYASSERGRVQLFLQQGADFCTDGKSASLILMNRNLNMMDEAARLTVDLATGKHKLEPLFCSSEQPQSAACKRAMAKEQTFICPFSLVLEAPAQGKEDGFAYRVKDGALQHREPASAWRRIGKLADFDLETRSPSGRYELLTGRREANDYVYRSLIILDAQTGELLCLDERRITRKPARRIADCSGITVVGESEVHWLAEPDRLLVEGTLFDLEKLRAVTVGSLVR